MRVFVAATSTRKFAPFQELHTKSAAFRAFVNRLQLISLSMRMPLISMEKKASNQLNRRVLFASRSAHSCPALFLDRDGVIIEDCHYIKDPDQVQ